MDEIRAVAPVFYMPVVQDDRDPAIGDVTGPVAKIDGQQKEGKEPAINYIGAVTFAVWHYAQAQNRELLNAFRRPVLEAEYGTRRKEYRQIWGHSEEGRKRLAEQDEMRQRSLNHPSLLPVDFRFAIPFLRALAEDSGPDLPAPLVAAANEAETLLDQYLESPGVSSEIASAARDCRYGDGGPDEARFGRLRLESEAGVEEIPFCFENKYLKMLSVWSLVLASHYWWDLGVAAPFILYGTQPTKKCARLTYDIRQDLPSCSRLVLELDPSLTGEEVSSIYRAALEELGAAKRKRLSQKHLALACQAARVPALVDWELSFEEWNDLHAATYGEKPYKKLALYRRDCDTALRRLLHPKWKMPARKAAYPSIAL